MNPKAFALRLSEDFSYFSSRSDVSGFTTLIPAIESECRAV